MDTCRAWPKKFRVAIGGVLWAMHSQSSFKIQLLMSLFVVAAGAWLGATLVEWCILVLCIGTVLSAEAFNTSLEHFARAITTERNEEIRRALDVAAGAVLIASIAAAATGSTIFIHRLWLGFAE